MFRIMPGVTDDEPIQRTFENVKYAVNPALLVFESELAVDGTIALHELASVVKIPFFMSTTDLTTTRRWERGRLSVEFSTLAQGQTFVGHVQGVVVGAAPVNLITLSCVVPAGAKLYYRFEASNDDVDLRAYDGLVIAHEVAAGPAAADRYVITTQLTFRPFHPFGVP